MSHRCHTAVVPYKRACAFYGEDDRANPIPYKLFSPDDFYPSEKIELNGWKYDGEGKPEWGFSEKLYGDIWVKGDKTVFLLNESQYSNIGRFEVAIISDNKESIELFVRDFAETVIGTDQIEGPAVGHSWC